MTNLKQIPGPQVADREEELPYPQWVEIGLVVGFWGFYALLRVIWTYINSSEGHFHTVTDRFGGWVLFCTMYALITFFMFWGCRKLRPRNIGLASSFLSHLFMAFFITTITEYILNLYTHYFGWKEYESSIFYGVVFYLRFVEEIKAYTLVLVAGLGRDFFLRYTNEQAHAHELREKAHRLQNRLTSARLDALRMQINPHFLFNTLHVINTMADTNPEGVRRATRRLGELLRYALSSSDQQEVPLSEEVKFLRGYFEIQKLRLRDQLAVEVDIDPAARDALVPTLVLQPLAENAVKHGIQQVEGTGRIRVQVYRQKRMLIVRVEDNGPGITGEPEEEGCKGLENIRERLTHLYGSDHAFTLGDAELGGCCVEVRLPYHTEQDLHLEAVPEEDDPPRAAPMS